MGVALPPDYAWASDLSPTDQCTVATVLLIMQAPRLAAWVNAQPHTCYLVPTWADLDCYEQHVMNQIQRQNNAVESVVWTWQPGQVSGLSITPDRMVSPFVVRGNTLIYLNRISNITATPRKVYAEPRPSTLGEIFPEGEEDW